MRSLTDRQKKLAGEFRKAERSGIGLILAIYLGGDLIPNGVAVPVLFQYFDQRFSVFCNVVKKEEFV